MARLILEEGGQRRAFRVRDGVMTIGSSESCTLTLVSEDVAEVHAELEIREGTLILRPKPGVAPPKVLGRPVTQPTRLSAKGEFRIGSAVFRLQADDAAPAKTPRPVVSSSERARGGSDRERVTHRRRTVQKGIPTWLMLLIVVGVLAGGYFIFSAWRGDGAHQFDPTERLRVAVNSFNLGATDRALQELDNVDLERAPELKEQVDELRARANERQKGAKLAEVHVRASKVLESQLKKYVTNYLQGKNIVRARARVFVKRCDDFLEKYPKHPEIGWVQRYRTRFIDVAAMDTPPEFADLAWEVKTHTHAKPRNYTHVFKIIDHYLLTASGEDRDAALVLTDTHLAEREEYFIDRMQQSRYHWEKKEYGDAVDWLIKVIIQIGDPSMEQEAITYFLGMTTKEGQPVVDNYLGSYKKLYPETFEKLVSFPRIEEVARDLGHL